MMRTAQLGPTSTSGADPAATVPTTRSSTGAPTVSAARTAKPSIAELVNGGTASGASTDAEMARPRASANGTSAAIGPGQRSRTWARASVNEITDRGYSVVPGAFLAGHQPADIGHVAHQHQSADARRHQYLVQTPSGGRNGDRESHGDGD